MELFPEQQLIDGLKNRDNKVLRYLYESYYPLVRSFVCQHGGDVDESKDVFQESLVAIFRRLQQGELEITQSVKAYILATARNIWYKKAEYSGRMAEHHQEYHRLDQDDEPEGLFPSTDEDRYNLFQKHFIKLAQDCREILRLFYEKIGLDEIASRLGYKSGNYVKKRKFFCKEALVKSIKDDPAYESVQ